MHPETRVWLWHHGPAAAPDDACIGWLDPPLRQPADHRAALALAERIGRAPVVYASDRRRARQAARPLARAIGARIEITPALREIHYGEWEGQSWADIRSTDRERFDDYMRDWKNTAMPGGESHTDLEARVTAWWQTVPREGPVVVVAHAGSLRALASILLGWSPDDALGVALARGHYAVIDRTGKAPPEWNRPPGAREVMAWHEP